MFNNYDTLQAPASMFTQKDVKEANMFPQSYEEIAVHQRCRCRRVLEFVVTALAVWLGFLTVASQIQVSLLRGEVEELTTKVLYLTSDLKNLNEIISSNKMFNEFKTIEDTIYADEDQEYFDENKPNAQPNGTDSLEKLHKLTVIEDEQDEMDTEDSRDLYDDSDGSDSEDWYPDYRHINNKSEKSESSSEALINEKSSAAALKPNRTEASESADFANTVSQTSETGKRRKRRSAPSVNDSSSEDLSEYQSSDYFIVNSSDTNIPIFNFMATTIHSYKEMPRFKRQSSTDDQTKKIKNKTMVHVHAAPNHPNQFHPLQSHAPHNNWEKLNEITDHEFTPEITHEGFLRIKKGGLYFVYVQIYFSAKNDDVSWVLKKRNYIDTTALIYCSQSSISPLPDSPKRKAHSCFSASLIPLLENDLLFITCAEGSRDMVVHRTKSFMGMIMV